MQEEINSLEEKLNLLAAKIGDLRNESGSFKPKLHKAEEEIKMLKAKISEATIKIENLIGQIPD